MLNENRFNEFFVRLPLKKYGAKIGHLHEEVTWPMLRLNHELESCWSQKLTEHIKIIQHPKIWEETHLREIIYSTLIFNKVVWFVLATMLEGILLPSNRRAKTTFCLYLVKRLIATLRWAVNVTTSSFQHFSWSLSTKFVFKKR